MPNGYVANTDVDNRSKEPIRRINLEFKFAFEIKMEVVRPIILNTLKSHPLVEKNPEPDAWLDSLGESDFKVIARCWVKTEDYWPTYWEQLEAVKRALDEHGIETPIPRRIIYDGGKF
jgi:small conductance mechanosensitive channel